MRSSPTILLIVLYQRLGCFIVAILISYLRASRITCVAAVVLLHWRRLPDCDEGRLEASCRDWSACAGAHVLDYGLDLGFEAVEGFALGDIVDGDAAMSVSEVLA